jgi:ABC-2 type transport system permease protein
MTLIGVLLTALVIAREWERGTMEASLVTPLTVGELMVGKLLPYFVMGMMGLGLSVGLGMLVFGVPFRGSPGVYLLLSTLFLLASLGLGLLISAATRVQFVAAQISLTAGFLPAFFLSGLLFDLESAPWPIRAISHLIPARYFVSASQTAFLAGDVWSVHLGNALALSGMAVVLIGLARWRISKRLEG